VGIGLDPCSEAITASWQGLDKAWCLGRVSQGLPKPLDGIVNSVVEIHEGIVRPESLAELFSGDQLAWLFQKDLQDSEGLFGQPDPRSVVKQFSSGLVYLERAESDPPTRRDAFHLLISSGLEV
jgi:hypothetical protein